MCCKPQVLYTEVLSNPTLVVADLPALSSIAHARGSQLVVDNTFTPLAVTPARWGADVVVHSMTKFISGASDIIAGAVCGSSQFLQQLMDLHTGNDKVQHTCSQADNVYHVHVLILAFKDKHAKPMQQHTAAMMVLSAWYQICSVKHHVFFHVKGSYKYNLHECM
jgi:O-acetylhomoserine/O-acetylserine sulfhydrylase-like pyridoxal-dependent enzyme